MKIIDTPTKVVVESSQGQFEIGTLQSFDETEDRVIIACAEYIPQFNRGFVCDLDIEFKIYESADSTVTDYKKYHYSDLVLVYIPKKADMESVTQLKYIFYK